MTLPDGFLFSQSSLQDYADCQRRFQLRYLLHQAWPAVEAEPYLENERKMEQGAKFHTLVHQYLVGIPPAQIDQSISGDEVMQAWWSNYLQSVQHGVLASVDIEGSQRFEEITLSVTLNNYRLIAKYDELIIRPDKQWVILDWKTSRNHPRHTWLADRLQTHVYPFVLSAAGSRLIGGTELDPDHIEMIYWFTNQPEQPERFTYSLSGYKEDERYLVNLVEAIRQKTEPVFPLTLDVKRCLFCTYRSLCNRGVKAGDLEHLEEWLEPESPDEVRIDFDQIGEIEF